MRPTGLAGLSLRRVLLRAADEGATADSVALALRDLRRRLGERRRGFRGSAADAAWFDQGLALAEALDGRPPADVARRLGEWAAGGRVAQLLDR